MPRARFDEHRIGFLGCRTRWRLQCRRGPLGTPRTARHAGCGLHREFLYAEKFVGHGLGRPGLLLRSEECPGRLRSGVCGSVTEKARTRYRAATVRESVPLAISVVTLAKGTQSVQVVIQHFPIAARQV